jgi:excisionase family DNA binding protein
LQGTVIEKGAVTAGMQIQLRGGRSTLYPEGRKAMDTPSESIRPLTVEETMAILRVSRSTLYRLVDRKELQGYKIARRWLFDRGDVQAFIERKRHTGE